MLDLGPAWLLALALCGAADDPESGAGGLPVAELDAALPADERARALRLARNARFADPSEPLVDPARPEYSIRSIDRRWRAEPPHQASDVILIGTIEARRAFVASDRRGVYSELDVRTLAVLKDVGAGGPPLQPGDRITAFRRGGAVRLPAGGWVRRETEPDALPQSDRDYLLFLSREPAAEGFLILGGYEASSPYVEPLDVGSSYPAYTGLSLAELVSRLQRMIDAPE